MTGGFARVARARLEGRWHADAVVELTSTGPRPVTAPARIHRALPLQELTLLPALTDTHVHLGLTDAVERAQCRLARVLDLGWSPAIVELSATAAIAHPALDVRFAGAFLTAPGGYPTDRTWAPDGSAVELTSPTDAATAVQAQAAHGACVVKVALNAEAGPVPDDAVLVAIVRQARRLRLPVIAHAEGAGQVERAANAGVDALAHTPWTERQPDEFVRRCARRMTLISTLGMHLRNGDAAAFARAADNLTRFAAAGGTVAYGTDLGNGCRRLDLDFTEIDALQHAGITGSALVDALVTPGLLGNGTTVSVFPADVDSDEAVIAALPRTRPMRLADLEVPA